MMVCAVGDCVFEKLIVGSNSNDILARFIAGGVMEIGAVHPPLSQRQKDPFPNVHSLP